jgi:Glycosyl hydrolase family 115/Gylcosyl hydrolase family 115 C-terminal domain
MALLVKLARVQRPLGKLLSASLLAVILLGAFGFTGTASTDTSDSRWVRGTYRKGDFKLVYDGRAADIVISKDEFKVVRIAASDLTSDIERVTGRKPKLITETSQVSGHVVLAGTLGNSPLLDSLVRAGKLDVSRLRGQWESFIIATVPHPLPGVQLGLVVVGSDRRGTAFGLYELSQAIGVSPWYWWADVKPSRRTDLVISAGTRRYGPPSVQYRGIFLNDEDWGLQPWAAKTFEPEVGDIGPKTYARVFELLLRLKANTVWPAMHECTRAFNLYAQNKLMADDYAIVMGSSHAEPMLRNNVSEWKGKPEDYNYLKNAEGVRHYWEERVAENGHFENIYTLGMRGIHDSAMQGPKTSPERITVLEQIFADQRNMLAQHVNSDVTKIPQIFIPYKEVLTDYRNGLHVPDDVTIVWPDDNFGYIRYFPTAEERARAGGFGVYYHISYLGRPLSYLWLETTPPALIWEEMSKAYDHGARRFWMLNVGDLKPGEIGIELFMQMAWDISKWRTDNLPDFLSEWARREFGAEYATKTAAVMDQYYRLAFARKPEHLQWYLPGEPPHTSDLTNIDYGDEVQARLDAYTALMARTDRLYASLPPHLKDAFYELVVYPVRGAALANRRFFLMEKSGLYAEQGRASASRLAQQAKTDEARMKAETEYYNERLAGGKWRHMMAIEMKPGQWTSMRSTPPEAPAALSRIKVTDQSRLGVAIEGRREALTENQRDAVLPVLSVFRRGTRFIDVFNIGHPGSPAGRWTAKASHDWIKLSQSSGNLRDDARIRVAIDWAKAPKGNEVFGMVQISGLGTTRIVRVPVFNPVFNLQPPRPEQLRGFVESGGAVSIEAEHFTAHTDRGGAGWRVIPGLGRTGDSVAVFPTTTNSVEATQLVEKSPALEYRIFLFHAGKVTVTCYLVPTQPLQAGNGLRYAIGIDDEPRQVVTVGAEVEVSSRPWSLNVLNAMTAGTTTHKVANAGAHKLKIYMVDAGVVLDKIVMDTGGLRPSYLGPRETRVVTRLNVR